MSNMQDTIAAALAREPGLTAAECKDLQLANGSAYHEIEKRYRMIRPGGGERNRIAATGTAEELAAIEREFEQLKVELQRNRSQSEALTQRRAQAEASEASRNLPELQGELVEAIRIAEVARDSLERALSGVDAVSTAVRLARATAQRANLPVADAHPDTIDRLATLSRYNVTGRHAVLDERHLSSMAESLGVQNAKAAA